MAKANWLKVNPSQGSGNATVNVSSTAEHTGRNVRTTTLTWKAANVAKDVVRTVNQAGKPAFVDIADTASADKIGQTVTITGVSNSKKLTFTLGLGDLELYLPNIYIANGSEVANGTEIMGDPGASAEYTFSITFVVPANTTTESLSRKIIVTDESGNQDVCILTSAAGDAYLTVQEGTIELNYQGKGV